MWFAVLDTETTGMEEHDQVLEVAIVLVPQQYAKNHVFWRTWTSLVKPPKDVPVVAPARAAHHITDAELDRAQPMAQVFEKGIIPRLKGEEIVLVAHNIEFDMRLMRQSNASLDFITRRICTNQCARHLFRDSPGYSNQVLRYHLGLDVPKLRQPPHRALPDALVTAALLAEELTKVSPEELMRLSVTPVLLETVDNGQYKGKQWADLKDANWMEWVTKQDGLEGFSKDKRYTAKYYLDILLEQRRVIREEQMRKRQEEQRVREQERQAKSFSQVGRIPK